MNLVFFDIDGTLAEGVDVPESAKRAIHQLRMKGSLVWICTGRPLSYAKRNFHMYANGYVVFNGREAYTCCEKLFSNPLTHEEIALIKSRLDEVNAGYCFYDNKQGYFYGNEKGYDYILNAYGGELIKNEDIDQHQVFNMDIWFEDDEHFERIKENTKDILILNRHGNYPTCDATVLPLDKGTGIEKVIQFMKVDKENTYAFGDGTNDIAMFEAVQHTCAMGNGVQSLKEIAEFVTTDIDQDGLYNGLKHFNLI